MTLGIDISFTHGFEYQNLSLVFNAANIAHPSILPILSIHVSGKYKKSSLVN